MYIRKTKTGIHVPFLFKNICKVEQALLDSSASYNFLDPKTAICLRITLLKLKQPVKVLNVNGANNAAGIINSYMTLEVILGSQKQKLKFYMAKLRED
jgi:hypothetical protein